MSKLNIKQIAGPAAGGRSGTGAIPVFDGNLIRWCNVATTALQLPTGTTAQRPVGADAVNGQFRYNTDLGKIEALQSGIWSPVVNDIKNFLDLADVPKTYTAGKVLAVNAAGTGIEYIDPTVTVAKITDGPGAPSLTHANKIVSVKSDGTGLEYKALPLANVVAYKFRVNFKDTNPDPANPISEVPAGWTIDFLSPDTFRVTHNLGKAPSSGVSFGYYQAPDLYRNRLIGTTAIDIYYNGSNLNQCTINHITSSNTGAMNTNGHAYIQLLFTI